MPNDLEKQEPIDDDEDTLDPEKASQRDAEYSEQTGQLWSNYVKLAEKRDKDATTAWKEDMNGVIIFAGLYSAALTAFLVESYQNLQEDPAETSVALLKQTVSLLSQISQQIGPNGSQVNLSLPEPIPPFNASPSDRRVNTLWFLSLVLSLSAVLAATIVQQWAGYRMQVFQKLDNPIECSRIRQFLYEGTAKWNLNVALEAIPGLIHLALFLFFVGLTDFLFSLDSVVASITSAIILITVILYLGSTSLPLLSPQSPYQTPLSYILWWLSQKGRAVYGRNRGVQLSANMFDGRTQMAMQVSSGRSNRDARALCWFMTSPMNPAEFELFVNTIPASADSAHGQRIWNRVGLMHPSQARLRSTGISLGLIAPPLDDLVGRLGRFLQGCVDQNVLDEATRRRRAQSGVNAVLSLLVTRGNKMDKMMEGQWGLLLRSPTMTRILIYLASVDASSDKSLSDLDGTHTARRLCLSILTISTVLTHDDVRQQAHQALKALLKRCHHSSQVHQALDAFLKLRHCRPQTSESLQTSQWKSFSSETDKLRDVVTKFDSMIVRSTLKGGEPPDEAALKRVESSISRLTSWTHRILPLWEDTDRIWNNVNSRPTFEHTFATRTQYLIQYIPGATSVPTASAQIGPSCLPEFNLAHILPPWALRRSLTDLQLSLKASFEVAVSHKSRSDEGPLPPDRTALPFWCQREDSRLWYTNQTCLWEDLRDGGTVYGVALLVTAIEEMRSTITREAETLYLKTFDVLTADWINLRHTEKIQRCVATLVMQTLRLNTQFLITAIVSLAGNVLVGTDTIHTTTAREALTYGRFARIEEAGIRDIIAYEEALAKVSQSVHKN